MSFRDATPALAAALLFGIGTPAAKLLVGEMPPLLLAGLLYLGSGLGLALVLAIRRWMRSRPLSAAPPMPRSERRALLGACLFGGVLGPALLMTGLARSSAASASLLLNTEGVFTALIAWWIYRENADRQIVLGMAAIVAGGVLLAWDAGAAALSNGALFIVVACLCWGVDNNLTRKVSGQDPMRIAAFKGLVAGVVNTALAALQGASWPAPAALAASLSVGFLGYGLSLTLYVQALRRLGTARTGAYFSVAPLFGVIGSLALWPEVPGATFWAAGALMAGGVWLHVRERHEHDHTHAPLEHAHDHRHDAHDFAWDGREPHTHAHAHEPMTHRHPHYPDLHHRHPHGKESSG
jgi:drug/metabolite transporter (DMT)-like permease